MNQLLILAKVKLPVTISKDPANRYFVSFSYIWVRRGIRELERDIHYNDMLDRNMFKDNVRDKIKTSNK